MITGYQKILLGQLFRDTDQHLVANQVAVVIVHALEVIDIHHQQAEDLTPDFIRFHQFRQRQVESTTVMQAS